MLKPGKLPENILKRSVLKIISKKDKNILVSPKVGGDATVVNVSEERLLSIALRPTVINHISDVDRAVIGAINNIYVSFARPAYLEVSLLLPVAYEESELKEIMRKIRSLCDDRDIKIAGGHTEVTDAVKNPILNICAFGFTKEDRPNSKAKAGDDIIITKWIGLEGSFLIARSKEAELKKRFNPGFIDIILNYKELLDIKGETEEVCKQNISSLHDASTGGIMAALWEMGDASNVGFEVDLLSIPVRQETIEICEELELNPYELLSGGSLVITSSEGDKLVESLLDKGINATLVGKVTDNNDRVVILNDERRFVGPYRGDEISKII